MAKKKPSDGLFEHPMYCSSTLIADGVDPERELFPNEEYLQSAKAKRLFSKILKVVHLPHLPKAIPTEDILALINDWLMWMPFIECDDLRKRSSLGYLREAVMLLATYTQDLLPPAVQRGDVDTAVLIGFRMGYRLCQIEVLPHDGVAKIGAKIKAGAAMGTARKATKAVQRRNETQQAVRDLWQRNPKQSLSAIQQALAKLDGKPFGSQSLIEKNTVGMKRQA